MTRLFNCFILLSTIAKISACYSVPDPCTCDANWWTYPHDHCCRGEKTMKKRTPNCPAIRLNCGTVDDYDLSLCCPQPQVGIICSCNANWWTYPQGNCCRNEFTMRSRRPQCETIRLNCGTVDDYELSLCCPQPKESGECSCTDNWWTYPRGNCCRDQSTMKSRTPSCASFRLNCNTVGDYDLSLCCPNPKACSCTASWWTYRPGHCCYGEETKKLQGSKDCATIRIDCRQVTDYPLSVCCPDPREGAVTF